MNNHNNPKPMLSPENALIPPHANELEQAVLGAILIEKEAFGEVNSILKPEMFYSPIHQSIFEAAAKLEKENKPIDLLTVVNQLKNENKLQVTDLPYIAELSSKVGSSAHIVYHAHIIRQKFIEREVLKESQSAINKVCNNDDIGDVIYQTGKNFESLQETLLGSNSGSHISIPVNKALNEMHMRIDFVRRGIKTGIETGLNDLNKMTHGWKNSDLIILAARPAMGKTAHALQFAKEAAKSGTPVAIFSLEMSGVSLSDRMLLSECENVDADHYKSGYMSNNEIDQVEQASLCVSQYPIYVDDKPSVTMQYIKAKSRILKKQGKCGMIIVDYLQLAEADDKSPSRELEVAKMSKTAKGIARELDVPFLLLAQLNRGVESRSGIDGKKPQLSDLRESGAIEQDADMVIFIYRPQYYGFNVEHEGQTVSNYGELIIAKHRNGATGTVKFTHSPNMTRFYDFDTIKKTHLEQ